MSVTPIFVTKYDSAKPIRLVLDKDIGVNDLLKLYIFRSDKTLINKTQSQSFWYLYERGPEPWSVIPAGQELFMYLDAKELYNQAGAGTFYGNLVVESIINSKQESFQGFTIVISNKVTPNQNTPGSTYGQLVYDQDGALIEGVIGRDLLDGSIYLTANGATITSPYQISYTVGGQTYNFLVSSIQ